MVKSKQKYTLPIWVFVFCFVFGGGAWLWAQDPPLLQHVETNETAQTVTKQHVTKHKQAQTLADIRQEIVVLLTELQDLQRELAPSHQRTGTEAISANESEPTARFLHRLNSLENTIASLTGKTEELTFRIDKIVRDGTKRIADINFRLIELEGGDPVAHPAIAPLGQGLVADETTSTITQNSAAAAAPQPEFAIGERSAFEQAQMAFYNGNFARAAEQFALFNQTYPGGPWAAHAYYYRAQALEKMGRNEDAATAYLNAYSANLSGVYAADSLYRLALVFERLQQPNAACSMLSEIQKQYTNAAVFARSQATFQRLACAAVE